MTPPSSPPPEINAITFHCADMVRSIAFYELLGAALVFGGPESPFATLRMADGADNYVNLQHKPGFTQAGGAWGRVILHVADPDELHDRLLGAGIEPEMAPSDAPWGERYFHVRDPDGHEVSLACKLEGR